ncbi:hypothetical protein [Bradyrhizobium sp. CCGE-LA001]|uniref:hypothetical protein n=1 Tax=Bradyrhizobium sp. CCGE-LA001 TaxID=1223566 RepID=UPI0002AAB2E8|nr:hypothetical protein [Bradyrhizobium sp. CCGE-LA001]AMA58063.1 hypothetical protein BCCGELA001_18445 [Bradyrhizobium sp. CCGE-LA001]
MIRYLKCLPIIALASSPTFALDNCDSLAATKQIEERPQCLQKNNAELQAAIQSINAIRANQDIVIQTGEYCLNGDHGAPNHLTRCTGGTPTRFKLVLP